MENKRSRCSRFAPADVPIRTVFKCIVSPSVLSRAAMPGDINLPGPAHRSSADGNTGFNIPQGEEPTAEVKAVEQDEK